MTRTFDLVVIGTGAGAATVATRCRAAGWSVAIVDSRPYGGTCALRGCVPKKVLVVAAEAVDLARRLAGKGVGGELAIRWGELMRFRRTFTEPVPAKREQGFVEAGIVTLHGRARFEGPTALRVGDERLEARKVHVATGAKPAVLPIPGFELLTTSDAFLELDELPERIVFLGSGYISFELAHVARAAGARVTMLEMQDRPLAGFDADLVGVLAEGTAALGIDLRVSTRVEAIEQRGTGLIVRASANGERLELEADLVVHGAGRVPDLDDLGLEEAGVDRDEQGILVNPYMQSVSNPAVYAAGDAAKGGLPLTPVASLEAGVAAANLVGGNRLEIEYPSIPSVVFTTPPLATVGLQESEAREQGLRFETHQARTSEWFSARSVGEEHSAHKILVEEGTGRILGAHLLGPRADELINLFALALRCDLTSADLKQTLFVFPTLASDVASMV